MDHLVQEIKENLRLGAPPPTPASLADHLTNTTTQQTPASGGSGVLGAHPSPISLDVGASSTSLHDGYHQVMMSPSGGKMKGGPSRGARWGGSGSHRSSPYHVPPSSRSVLAMGSAGSADTGVDGNVEPSPEAVAALRRKWATGRRRYPSTCMNNNPTAGALGPACKNIDPDDPFAILQELISGGSLIKEAVRRLQKPGGPLGGLSHVGSPTGAAAGRMTPMRGGACESGRRTAYDSEESDNEDCRTPEEDETRHGVLLDTATGHSELVVQAGGHQVVNVGGVEQAPPSVRNRSFPSSSASGCEMGL